MTRRATLTRLLLAAMLLVAAAPARAGVRLADVRGHVLVGYAKLFDTGAPGGSLSIGAGADHPVGDRFRVGFDIGYHLLGSRTLTEGSISTGLDYSVFEALAMLHWAPERHDPIFTLSGGPGLFVARAVLGASPVGASFSGSAIEQTHLGLALGATVARRGTAPVRLGLQAGVRVIPLDSSTWTLATARVALLY
jgi:hypothetical protein